jgi:hypothetical protein
VQTDPTTQKTVIFILFAMRTGGLTIFILVSGKRDELVSPSGRLMVGQPFIGGTGTFSLLHKLSIA